MTPQIYTWRSPGVGLAFAPTVRCNYKHVADCVSVTELAREQPLDGSLMNAKSNDASVVVSAANSGVLPSPDVLNDLDMIHSWLQQSEKHADTDSNQMMPMSFTCTSVLPSAGATYALSKQLPVSTSSWHAPAANISTVRRFMQLLEFVNLSSFTAQITSLPLQQRMWEWLFGEYYETVV